MEEYDFSNAIKNPYVQNLKDQEAIDRDTTLNTLPSDERIREEMNLFFKKNASLRISD